MANTVLLILVVILFGLLMAVSVAYYLQGSKTRPRQAGGANHHAQMSALSIVPMSEALSSALQDTLAEMRNCQAIAYVDIRANRLIGLESKMDLPPAVVELIVAAVSDVFNAPNLVLVSNAFNAHRGKKLLNSSNVKEHTVRGDGTVYILIRAQSDIDHVCVFACSDEGNLGDSSFGWLLSQARSHMSKIEVAAEAAFLAE